MANNLIQKLKNGIEFDGILFLWQILNLLGVKINSQQLEKHLKISYKNNKTIVKWQ